MTLNLPEWYTTPGFHDVEKLILDYFDWILPTVYCGTAIPDGWWSPDVDPSKLPEAVLRVWRMPGRADPQIPEDEALVNIAALSRNRQESWRLNGFVRDVMRVLPGLKVPRAEGGVTVVDTVSEWVGPSQRPEAFIDDKFVDTTFRLSLGMRRIKPDYRQVIKTLPTP
jgi:hypothetical protein